MSDTEQNLHDAIAAAVDSDPGVSGVLVGYVVIAEVYEADGERSLVQTSSAGSTVWARIGMLDAALARNRHDFIDTRED